MKNVIHHLGPERNRSCIVCGEVSTKFLMSVKNRDYHRCRVCQATFLNPEQRLPIDEEHARYRLHRNDSQDMGYRQFLLKLVEPLLKRLRPGAKGLDYGCGPGPALADMLRDAGHHLRLFDPLFFPDSAPLKDQYDFITCTEVIEHFHRPAEEFSRFDRMLRPGGWLALMTCFQTEDDNFVNWHYRRDSTHVVFFREATLRHIARQFRWHCEIPVKDVALMQKSNDTITMHQESLYAR